MIKKALFLDRDGVINHDFGYVHKIEDFKFIDGIFELLNKAQNNGYLIFIITNQSGIRRGYYTEEDFHKLMNYVLKIFKQHGISITNTYFCPEIDNKAPCRKPNPGMILQAQKDYNIDLSNSILVGDKISDILAGINAGVYKNILFDPEYKFKTTQNILEELKQFIKSSLDKFHIKIYHSLNEISKEL